MWHREVGFYAHLKLNYVLLTTIMGYQYIFRHSVDVSTWPLGFNGRRQVLMGSMVLSHLLLSRESFINIRGITPSVFYSTRGKRHVRGVIIDVG